MFLPHHGDEMEMRHLKVCGDYGQIAIIPFHARDKDSIRDARAMGFKGVPREVVYKPAGGRAVTYMLAQE